MLTPEQVIPFLSHEEGYVRRQAAEYLAGAHDPSPATAEDVWRAIDRHGMWGPSALVTYLRELPQTEESLWRAMGALGRTLDERSRDYLEAAVESVGMPLLERFSGELLAGLQLSDEAKAYLWRRLDLSRRSASELWDELMALGRDRGDDKGPDEDAAALLVHAIGARADEGVIAKAMVVLRDENVTDWREVFAVDALGAARHAAAADMLLEKLRADDDVMPERAVDALVKIGTAEVVEKLGAFLPAEERFVRMFGVDALGRIKCPESEALLLKLLDVEKDRELRTVIGENLCLLGAPAAVLATLRDQVAAGRLGHEMYDLEGMILSAGRMAGYEPPERKKWEERVRRQDVEMERLRDEWDREEDDGGIYEVEGPTAGESPFVPGLDPEVTWPIHRQADKVGRNDPCPCGSGKKYKKCCGKE